MVSQTDLRIYEAGNKLDAVDTSFINSTTVLMTFVDGDEPSGSEIQDAFGGMFTEVSSYQTIGQDDDGNDLVGVLVTIEYE